MNDDDNNAPADEPALWVTRVQLATYVTSYTNKAFEIALVEIRKAIAESKAEADAATVSALLRFDARLHLLERMVRAEKEREQQ